MVRDFSKAKKEELYRALELIDDREWKPFMAWCGGRTVEFGEWAERLSISTYTRQVDNYQNRVLEVNDSTRNQMDITFEGVAETDRRYAQIFQGHAETVREQIRRVQTMLQVMQSANRNGTDIRTITCGMNLHPEVSYMERFENAQRVLLSYLKVRGVTDPAEQQEICDWIMGNQMHMLEKLYEADCYGSVDAGTIYNSLMDCYIGYKTEVVFMSYLNENEITDLAEQQKIYGMIMENQPSMLRNLYMAVEQNHEDADTIFYSIMDYYNKHKMDITIEDLEGLDMGERMDQTQRETFVACWNKLGQMEISKDHMIAVMANIFAESRFSATNAQESYGYKGLYDDYKYETGDDVGYGICQWSLEARKIALLEYANNTGGSVHDLETQLNYFQYEMEEGICIKGWKNFLLKNDRNEAIKYFWKYILISGNSKLGEGNPKYEKALKEHIEYADHIEEWYDTTFQREVREK